MEEQDVPADQTYPSITFSIIKQATGRVVSSGVTMHLEDMVGEDEDVVYELAPPNTYWRDGAFVACPARPTALHAFDYDAEEWVDPRSLADLKLARWTAMKFERDTREAAGFPYMGKMLDSNPRSVQRINTVVQAAQAAIGAGEPFSIDWTCADNSLLTLAAEAVLGMPVALALYADELHQTGKALRAQILAATTPAEVAAVSWPADDPPE